MVQKMAKSWIVDHWLNTNQTISLENLRGRVILLVAFQMLCPGCVSHLIPQTLRVRAIFNVEEIAVVGLHTVFEHQKAQGTPDALSAFLQEYKITFPVGIDAVSDDGGPPKTMTAYGMQGTPTMILIDRKGSLRKHKFGHVQDMVLGAEIMSLIQEDQNRITQKDSLFSSPFSEGEVCRS